VYKKVLKQDSEEEVAFLLSVSEGLSQLDFSALVLGMVHTRVEVPRMDLWDDLGFSLCAAPSVYCMVTTSDDRKKSEIGVSADWCIAVEHQKLSSIRDYLCQLSD